MPSGGEIHARDDERARGARDGRDRSYQYGVGGSSKQHERTGVTAGALSGRLAASSPAGLAAANDLTIPYTTDLRACASSPGSVRARRDRRLYVSTAVECGPSNVTLATQGGDASDRGDSVLQERGVIAESEVPT